MQKTTDYFALVGWPGRSFRHDKRGAIPPDVQTILQDLDVREDNWVLNTQHFGSRFYRALGRVDKMRQLAKRTGKQWINGHVDVYS